MCPCFSVVLNVKYRLFLRYCIKITLRVQKLTPQSFRRILINTWLVGTIIFTSWFLFKLCLNPTNVFWPGGGGLSVRTSAALQLQTQKSAASCNFDNVLINWLIVQPCRQDRKCSAAQIAVSKITKLASERRLSSSLRVNPSWWAHFLLPVWALKLYF